MTTRKEELSKKYWQMKKDLKIEQNKGDEKLTLMVNASQVSITVLKTVPNFVPKKVKKLFPYYFRLYNLVIIIQLFFSTSKMPKKS